MAPEATRAEWAFLSIAICFFWLIFRSRDPRVGACAALGLALFGGFFAPELHRYTLQLALVSLLIHSLRWDDAAHRGATSLRLLAGSVWVLTSCTWLFSPVDPARLLVYGAASSVLAACLLHLVVWRVRPRLFAVLCAGIVLFSDPFMLLKHWLGTQSSGMIAIVASFVLFAVGTMAALSKRVTAGKS